MISFENDSERTRVPSLIVLALIHPQVPSHLKRVRDFFGDAPKTKRGGKGGSGARGGSKGISKASAKQESRVLAESLQRVLAAMLQVAHRAF